jgi:hypothetical protein
MAVAMRLGRRSATAFAEARSPLGFRGGLSNLSDYVGDDPTNATDPSGLFPKSVIDGRDKKTEVKPNIDEDLYPSIPIKTDGFDGKIYASVRAEIVGEKNPAFFAGYEGKNAQDVRWIQVVRVYVRNLSGP